MINIHTFHNSWTSCGRGVVAEQFFAQILTRHSRVSFDLWSRSLRPLDPLCISRKMKIPPLPDSPRSIYLIFLLFLSCMFSFISLYIETLYVFIICRFSSSHPLLWDKKKGKRGSIFALKLCGGCAEQNKHDPLIWIWSEDGQMSQEKCHGLLLIFFFDFFHWS